MTLGDTVAASVLAREKQRGVVAPSSHHHHHHQGTGDERVDQLCRELHDINLRYGTVGAGYIEYTYLATKKRGGAKNNVSAFYVHIPRRTTHSSTSGPDNHAVQHAMDRQRLASNELVRRFAYTHVSRSRYTPWPNHHRAVYTNTPRAAKAKTEQQLPGRLYVIVNPHFPQMLGRLCDYAYTVASSQHTPGYNEVMRQIDPYFAAVGTSGGLEELDPETRQFQQQYRQEWLRIKYGAQWARKLQRRQVAWDRIMAAVYIAAAANLAGTASSTQLPPRLRAILGIDFDFGFMVDRMFGTAKHSVYCDDDDGDDDDADAAKVVLDLQVTVLRWLYIGVSFEPTSAVKPRLDTHSVRVERIVLSTEWCFYVLLRKLIHERFAALRAAQRRERRWQREYTTKQQAYSERGFAKFVEFAKLCSSPAHEEPAAAPYPMEVLPFDIHDPFAVLKNVPLHTPAYTEFLTLCQVFSLDYAKLCKPFQHWADALQHVHPHISLQTLADTLSITIYPTSVTISSLVSQTLHTVDAIRNDEHVSAGIRDVRIWINSHADGNIPPFILQQQFRT